MNFCSNVVLDKCSIIFLCNLNNKYLLLKLVNKLFNLLLIPFSLIILYVVFTGCISIIYAEVFEFNEKDYYSSSDNEPTNSQEKSTNSEDTGKENCITNQEASVLQTSTDSDTYLNNFHFIKKFDKEGNVVDSWGTVGSNDGQFLHAHGITIDLEDNVYVSDGENCNIQKFDSDGNFITKWGAKGVGPSKFMQPESMAVDSLDNVYVAEYSGKNIQKFDSDGKFLTMWGSLGCKDDQFLIPHDIAIDSEGYLYVTDSGKSHFRANYDCNNNASQ